MSRSILSTVSMNTPSCVDLHNLLKTSFTVVSRAIPIMIKLISDLMSLFDKISWQIRELVSSPSVIATIHLGVFSYHKTHNIYIFLMRNHVIYTPQIWHRKVKFLLMYVLYTGFLWPSLRMTNMCKFYYTLL